MSVSLQISQQSGNYNDCEPLFVDKVKVLLVGYGSIVQAVSTDTGELLGKFSGHSHLVSSLSCPSNCDSTKEVQCLAVSSSIDGVIFVWRVGDFSVVTRLDTGMAVYKVIVPRLSATGAFITGKPSTEEIQGRNQEELYLVVGKNSKGSRTTSTSRLATGGAGADDKVGNDRFKLVLYDIATRKVRRKVSTLRNVKQCIATLLIGKDEHIVVASKRRLLVYSTQMRQGPKMTNSTGVITCLVVCQATGVIVTGHEKGELCVWHNVPQWVRAAAALGSDVDAVSLEPPVFTTLHWHAHPVQALGMSADGQYIYSGGEEAVLVVWQVATGFKSFVPRLGGVITHIGASIESPKLAATTMDNCIHVIDSARQREEWSLRGLFVTSARNVGRGVFSSGSAVTNVENFLQSDPNFQCVIKIDPLSNLVMCNGYPGQLQALELGHRGLRGSHEVAQYTRVSRTEAKTRIYVPSVTHFEYAVCGNNAYLSTLDVRRGEDKDKATALKFWRYDTSRNEYKLSAQVEHPHGRERVNALALHASPNSDAVCITGASDGSVKFWRAQQAQSHIDTRMAVTYGADSKDTAVSWTCAFSFKHKDSPVLACVISRDGSTLAISQENVISLWDPADVSLRATLLAPGADAITYLDFLEPRASAAMGGGAGNAYLVAGSSSALYLFDLLTLQLCWCASGNFKGAAFAVTSIESETFSSDVNGIKHYGYIAASVQGGKNDAGINSSAADKESSTPSKSQKGKTHKDFTASDDEDAEDDNAYVARRAPNSNVCFFSVHSPVPIITEIISSTATSLCFTSNKEKNTPAMLCVTEANELLLLNSVKEAVPEASVGDVLAKMKSPTLPGLPITLFNGNNTLPEAAYDFVSPMGLHTQVNETLSSMMTERSEALPAVSAVSSSFLGMLLRVGRADKLPKNNELTSNASHSVDNNSDHFVLPGFEDVVNGGNDKNDDVDDDDEEESRVFAKRTRSRSMSFEVRGDTSIASKTAMDTSFLQGRVEILEKSLNCVFGTFSEKPSGACELITPASSSNKSKTKRTVSEKTLPHSATKNVKATAAVVSAVKVVDPIQTTESFHAPIAPVGRGGKLQSSLSNLPLPLASTGRASRSNSITSIGADSAPAAPARKSRARASSTLSDVSESSAAVRSTRKRTGSVLSELSDASNVGGRRSTRRTN